MKSIEIPASVASIELYAFAHCGSLKTAYIYNSENVLLANDGSCPFQYIAKESVLYAPKAMKEAYEASPYKDAFSRIESIEDLAGIGNVGHSVSEKTMTQRYNLGGGSIGSSLYGVNIVRMSDGTVKKVVVK